MADRVRLPFGFFSITILITGIKWRVRPGVGGLALFAVSPGAMADDSLAALYT